MPKQNEELLGFNSRMNDVETEVAALTEGQKALNESQRQLTRTFEKFVDTSSDNHKIISSKMDSLSEKVAGSGKPNWVVLASAFTIAMAIVGYFVESRISPLIESKKQDEIRIVEQKERINYIEGKLEENKEKTIQTQTKWELWEKGLLIRKPDFSGSYD